MHLLTCYKWKIFQKMHEEINNGYMRKYDNIYGASRDVIILHDYKF